MSEEATAGTAAPAGDQVAELRRRLDEISWYHTQELAPGIVTPGMFDLRPLMPHYGIPEDLSGLRALDVGTFEGFWAFELERRGAEVTALDVDSVQELDWSPRSRPAADSPRGEGFELARAALGSSVNRVGMSIYEATPEALGGRFDLILCGSVLVHLRDPVLALERMAALCRGQADPGRGVQPPARVDAPAEARRVPRRGPVDDVVASDQQDLAVDGALRRIRGRSPARALRDAVPRRPRRRPARRPARREGRRHERSARVEGCSARYPKSAMDARRLQLSPWPGAALEPAQVVGRSFATRTATIRFDGDVYLGPGFSLHMPHGGTFIVGPGVDFRRGFRAELRSGRPRDHRRRLGVLPRRADSVRDLDRDRRAVHVRAVAASIVDGNHRFRDLDRPMLEQGYDFRPITIADDAVVTTKCTIINDLGERCFIGANTVVTRPVPAYTVAVGVPARLVDYFGPEELRPSELQLALRDVRLSGLGAGRRGLLPGVEKVWRERLPVGEVGAHPRPPPEPRDAEAG